MVGYLDMTDPKQQCPDTWQKVTSPRSSCGKKSTAPCDSLTITTSGASYQTVCGRFEGYQIGSPDAFRSINPTSIETYYVDGVTVTYGLPGNRHHVYTYAAGVMELNSSSSTCPCTGGGQPPPLFVGSDYYCESGCPGPAWSYTEFYYSDVLWDRQQCGGNESTCCNPPDLPWFCKTFPTPISENLEVRICTDEGFNNENVAVESFALYIQVTIPLMNIQTVSILKSDYTLRQLEISWIPVGGNVTIYTVRVVGADGSVGQGPTSSAFKNISSLSYSNSIGCSFLNNQSFYCVVCCSTDPSVPPDSSVYNFSTTRGTEVNVSLQGLTSGQMYYCKAAATNISSASCAGPVVGGVKMYFSFVASFPSINPPTTRNIPLMNIQAASVLNSDNTLCQLEISWIPVGGNVTIYTVRVVGADGSVGQGCTVCTTSPCLYVHQVTDVTKNYSIFVTSVNQDGTLGSQNSTTIGPINSVFKNISILSYSSSVDCSFLNNQSFYCMVCCSTDPSVPPDSSVYNISTTRGTEVTVFLQGLTSGQMYFCKAAATNKNSAHCAGQVVGSVKMYFNFVAYLPSIPNPTTPAILVTNIQAVSVLNPDNMLCQLEISWIPVGGNVTIYTVRVVGADSSVGQGPTSSVLTNISSLSYSNSFSCSFLNNQSFYCVVCCNTDPSVPPDSSVYNISTTRGTEVSVFLQGLTSGQMYYCKAAATNISSASCTGPVVGGVKMYFSFVASLPSINPPTTLSIPLTNIQAASVLNPDNTLRQLEISWIPVGGNVTIYTVRVVGADGSVGQGCTVCTIYPCLYVHQVTHVTDNYSIFVTSMNQDGTLGSQNSTTFGPINSVFNNISALSYSNSIGCSFLNNQSFYCVVCCSTDPSNSSVYNISTTRGTEVTVSLQGLTSGQMYYCKAAATNTNSASCISPVLGGVKMYFTFVSPIYPITPPITPHVTSNDMYTIIGISISISLFVLSLGVLAATCIVRMVKTRSKVTLYHPTALEPSVYEMTDHKNITSIKVETNSAYGIAN
eukprot:Em0001g3815a